MAESLPRSRLLVPAASVEVALDRLAGAIQPLVHGGQLTLLGVLMGGLLPLAWLAARLDGGFLLDSCRASRYGDGTRGGVTGLLMPPASPVAGRTVLLVDDIFDEGLTLDFVRRHCLEAGAAHVLSAVLVRKRHDRCQVDWQPDFTGLEVPDGFVFGAGMDWRGQWRHLPDIHLLLEDER
ncbi:MAG: hypoxanthine-guanine phosphoribosyltransferase [Chromatiales bacterium]|nr:hypoxanthine-guanine phosphoribosyltransferase [Chromatiales bacterium]